MKQEHKNSILVFLQKIKDTARWDIKTISLVSFLMALIIVMNIFTRVIIIIPVFGQMRISFSVVFLVIMGFVLNPILAFLGGFLVDIISFFLGGIGVFHIGFAFSSGLQVFLASFLSVLLTRNTYRREKLQVIVAFLLIFSFSLYLLIDNSLKIETYIRAIVSSIMSIIALSVMISILWKRAQTFVSVFFIVLITSITNSLLTSIWLNQLFGIDYNILLWPRVFKTFTFDIFVISLLIFPFKIICEKKKLYWFL